MVTITSAAGILALLDEDMVELQVFALKKLLLVVDEFWAEISDAIEKIEMFHENKDFPERELAALVASKVYFHLGSYDDSLRYALLAGPKFDVNANNLYVETTVAKCIDSYISRRMSDKGQSADPRQEEIVNCMFQRCLDDKEYKQALGIAIEAKRLDVFKMAITNASDVDGMLSYAFRVAMTLIQNRTYRAELLRNLVELYRGLKDPDYVQMCQCLIFLDDPKSVAKVLEKLSQGSDHDAVMAYQIAFDMYESATQQFLNNVVQAIRTVNDEAPSATAADDAAESDPPSAAAAAAAAEAEAGTAKDDDQTMGLKEMKARVDKLSAILSGEKTIYCHLQFLIRNDHSDLLILKQTKDAVRVSVCHTATVIANGFMHSGTTHDAFLRDNLDWLGRATNWAKLSATASLGVIHRGHEKESLALMQSYLPRDAATSSGYAEGGGLFALGLIHANHGADITDYLTTQLRGGTNEQIRHGGCLGLGLAAMGTHKADVYELLKTNLYQDDAVTGEAAGLAMGLVELGSNSSTAIHDMVSYAQETQHEKILRGLAVGIALVMYGRLEEADPLIETLRRDKDAVLRRSGMYTIAMAYCGTGSNKAIRRLLHVAVSDVNDDVRRAAVMGLGFILFKNPDHCPGVVSLLSESYNAHVRYGAAMALGIACAGTGSKEAINLIEPMINDPVNYVRQGALIASALILIQHTELTCPKVKEFRTLYAKVIGDKHEDVMAKFGAILAQGIIDAGGRNVTVSLQSRTGHTNMTAVVGMLAFTQYWYWFPLSHFLSLAFTPSCLIALNEDLDMPVVSFKSNARPSTYGYPPMLEEKKKEDKEKVTTAVLSITNKQKKKEAEKKKEKEGEKMEVDESEKKDPEKAESGSSTASAAAKEPEKDADKDKKKADEKKEEPTWEILENPTRVIKPQLKHVTLEDADKYKPLKDIAIGGIVMMEKNASEPWAIVKPVEVKKAGATADDEAEPEPPEPFEWTDE